MMAFQDVCFLVLKTKLAFSALKVRNDLVMGFEGSILLHAFTPSEALDKE